MVKALLASGLIVVQATAALATPMTSGLDSNRAALGLPVGARLASCVAPVGAPASACGAAGDGSDLAGGTSLAVILALSALAAVSIGIASTAHGHHHGSSPVSP
jgi:hypothetical protein